MSVSRVHVVASSDYTRFYPTSSRGKRGVILFHGAGNPNEFEDPAAQLHSVILALRLAGEGIPCIAGAFGGDTWANDTSLTQTGGAFTALQGMGAAADSFIGVGVSMGHANLLRYAIANPTKVAAGVGIIPLVDLTGFYSGNTHGFQTAIASAWGVSRTDTCGTTNGSGTVTDGSITSGDVGKAVIGAGIPAGATVGTVTPGVSFTLAGGQTATATSVSVALTLCGSLPATADLLTNATALAGKPWRLGYSTGDTYITPSSVTSLVATIGATATAQAVSTQDHGDGAVGDYVNVGIPEQAASDLIGFLIANGA